MTIQSDMSATTSALDCSSMAEVRAEIDRLDRVLVRLIAERLTYIEAAGRIKQDRSTVRLEWRIEEVVQKVLAEAEKAGLPARIAEPVWRELIERSIDHEHDVFDEIHANPARNAGTKR